jgi:hypothetical protein
MDQETVPLRPCAHQQISSLFQYTDTYKCNGQKDTLRIIPTYYSAA